MGTKTEEANLILKLYELRREEVMRKARDWFIWFNPGSMQDILDTFMSDKSAYYRMVVSYWEMAASFVANGILNRELFYRSNNMELLVVWEKIRRFVPEQRAAIKDPLRYKQIEEVAKGFVEYLNENAPGFFENWAAGLSRPAQPVAAASR